MVGNLSREYVGMCGETYMISSEVQQDLHVCIRYGLGYKGERLIYLS